MKRIMFRSLDRSEVVVVRESLDILSNIILATIARRLIRKDCETYLAYVIESSKGNPNI